MRVVVIAVGRPRDPHLAAAIGEYEARAARYFSLDAVETTAARGDAPEAVRRREARELLRRLPPGLEVIALTRRGRPLTSRDLAVVLSDMATYGLPGVVFVVGGAYGLDGEVISRADRCLSLSTLTLPHDLARLVLAEQLYRAGTIMRGEPYHKGD